MSISEEVYLRFNKERVLVEGMAISLLTSFNTSGPTQPVDWRLSLHSDGQNFASFTRIVDKVVIDGFVTDRDYLQIGSRKDEALKSGLKFAWDDNCFLVKYFTVFVYLISNITFLFISKNYHSLLM